MPQPAPNGPQVPPRQALQERVAAAILDAAAGTLAAGGERMNLGDVAVAAGVARATVYRYFPNRARLLDELTHRTAVAAHERLTTARIEEVGVEEGLSRAVRVFVDLGDSFVVLLSERGAGQPDEVERLVASPLRRLLDRGRTAGRIRRDIPTAWLAESLLGVVAGVLRRGSLGRDDTVAAITNVFLHGASTESADPARAAGTSAVTTSTRRRTR